MARVKMADEERKERKKVRDAKYRAENSEKIEVSSAKYRANNPEKVKIYMAEYRAKNREKMNVYDAKYRAKNPEKIKVKEAKYRAARLQQMPPWVTNLCQEDLESIYKDAHTRTKTQNDNFHVDHVYPLSSKWCRGLHVPWNLQVISAEENLKKNSKLPKNFYKNWADHPMNLRNDRSC